MSIQSETLGTGRFTKRQMLSLSSTLFLNWATVNLVLMVLVLLLGNMEGLL